MVRIHSPLRSGVLALVLAIPGAACAGDDRSKEAKGVTEQSEQPGAPARDTGPTSPAAQARSTLSALLQEHVVLATAATGSVLGARSDEFTAASAALEANTTALTGAVSDALGAEVGGAFDARWKQHLTFLVNYTQGLGAKDKAKQEQSAKDLETNATEVATVFTSALPELVAERMAELAGQHVRNLVAIVDAQGSDDQPKAYSELRAATGHAGLMAEALTSAMAAHAPDTLAGDPDSAAAGLATALNLGLREHVFLAAASTGSALAGRAEEFMAAAAALDANSNAITETMSNVYGADAAKAFNPLWERHIGFVVEYTTGLAARDKAKQDKAVTDLTQYSADFGAFFSTATPALAKETVSELIKTHILTLKDVIDAQNKGDLPGAYTKLRLAADHMKSFAEPLAAALVVQFPDKFQV